MRDLTSEAGPTPSDEILARFPEHARQTAVIKDSQIIGRFLEHGGYRLATVRELEGVRELVPVTVSIREVLAEYFGIDLVKLESEKREMVAGVQRWAESKSAEGVSAELIEKPGKPRLVALKNGKRSGVPGRAAQEGIEMGTMRDLTPESITALSDEEVVRIGDAWVVSQSLEYSNGRDALLGVLGEDDQDLVALRRAARARYAEYSGDTSYLRVPSALDSAVRWAYCAQAHPGVLTSGERAALTAGWGALRS